MSDDYETPAYTVDEIRSHDSEFINPLPRRTSFGVNGFAVQGRRDMLHHYARLCETNERLLALAKQYASECAECGGGGLVTIHNYDGHGSDADDQPCPECADIRAVIAKAAP